MKEKRNLEKILTESGIMITTLDEMIFSESPIDISATPSNRENILFEINDPYMKCFAFYRKLSRTNTVMFGATVSENKSFKDKQQFFKVQGMLHGSENDIYSEICKILNQREINSRISFKGISLDNASITGSGTLQIYMTHEYNIQDSMGIFLKNETRKSIIIGAIIYDTLRKFYDPNRTEFHDKITFDYEEQTQKMEPNVEARKSYEIDMTKFRSADLVFSEYVNQLKRSIKNMALFNDFYCPGLD